METIEKNSAGVRRFADLLEKGARIETNIMTLKTYLSLKRERVAVLSDDMKQHLQDKKVISTL